MKNQIKHLLPVLIVGLGLILTDQVSAQTFATLYTFTNGSDGANASAGLILSDIGKTFYGTAVNGGSMDWGTVFAVNTDGTGFTTVHDFNYSSEGAYPNARPLLMGNTLYGTAYQGGSGGNGTVFAVNTDGTGFANLHSFSVVGGPDSTNSDGSDPQSDLILSGNALYGVARFGGNSGEGTLFTVNIDGTGFRIVHTFTGGSGGSAPLGGLVLSGNTLYGIANQGGGGGNGTVFAVNTDGTGFTTVHGFNDSSDGAFPDSCLFLSGNTLYGEAEEGGSMGRGSVFAVNTDGTGFTNLHNFTGGSDGGEPFGGLYLVGNSLYGTTINGGAGWGTVFAANTNGTGFTNWYSFTNGSDGASPRSGVIFSGTNLYGTTQYGGSAGYGTVFSLSLGFGFPPTISGQPQSQTVAFDSTAFFRVYAQGYPPMTYQWYFNGTNATNAIIGATNSMLTVTNLQLSNAGSYWVAATDPSGTTWSSAPGTSLNVVPGIGINLVPALSLYGEIGYSYNVQYINSLGPTNAPWITLATVVLTNNPQFYCDTSAIGQPGRFYRIMQVP